MEEAAEPSATEPATQGALNEENSSGISPGIVNTNSLLVPVFAVSIVILIGGLLIAATLAFQRNSARRELKEQNIELTQREFHASVRSGSPETASQFLKAGFHPLERSAKGETALSLAIARGNMKVLEYLLQALGRLPEDQDDFGEKIQGERNLTSLIETECKGPTAPLQNQAAASASVASLLLLQRYGLRIARSIPGRLSPLFCAVAVENKANVDLLLLQGAELNLLEPTNRSVLAYATNSVGMFELLLERGADISIVERSGETPIFDAARGGNEAVVALLLQNKIDLNKTNYRGEKPWQVAEAANNLEIIPLLHPEYLLYSGLIRENPQLIFFALERGARVNISDRDGVTPLHVALSSGKPSEYRFWGGGGGLSS